MQATIQMQDVRRVYQMGETTVEALAGVSCSIFAGEFVAVMGASGSGKSTLLNLLGCLDRPSSGRYLLDGFAVERLDKDQLAAMRNRRIGFIFQQFNLLPRSTALANVELPLIYRGDLSRSERAQRAIAALEAVGLGNRVNHRPTELSGGQQQRVAIARALVTEPSILLADEPTGNLDSQASAEIMELFVQLHQRGIVIVLVTHDPMIASQAQRVLRIHDGRLIHEGGGLA